MFVDGWYSGAIPMPAHHGRIGDLITPHTVVIHAMDTHPKHYKTVLHNWCAETGEGTACHFAIGRTPSDGVVQLAPINRNANHAGGFIVHRGKREPMHGWWRLANGALVHPNVWAVGIELDAAGLLKHTDKGWIHPDSGLPIDGVDVVLDERGRGWHRVTGYQMQTLGALLDALMPELAPLPPGTTVKADGDHKANGVPWAAPLGPVVVGHATLDPVRKVDPGPSVSEFLIARLHRQS
jgi:hypothetical protein